MLRASAARPGADPDSDAETRTRIPKLPEPMIRVGIRVGSRTRELSRSRIAGLGSVSGAFRAEAETVAAPLETMAQRGVLRIWAPFVRMEPLSRPPCARKGLGWTSLRAAKGRSRRQRPDNGETATNQRETFSVRGSWAPASSISMFSIAVVKSKQVVSDLRRSRRAALNPKP